jgi:hypothetical protein
VNYEKKMPPIFNYIRLPPLSAPVAALLAYVRHAMERAFTSSEWMTALGKLRQLGRETAKINRIIEDKFEQIEAEDRL